LEAWQAGLKRDIICIIFIYLEVLSMNLLDTKESNARASSTKIRVAVLYGGRSAEHEVSLLSAANVIQYLDSSQFEVIPMGIDKQGNWFLGKEVFAKSLEHKAIPKVHHEMNMWFTPEWIGKSIEQSLPEKQLKQFSNVPLFDVIFPAVHGTFCEDGTLQGLLELADIPYVGCGVLSSAMGMDKDISKRLAMQAGIKVAPYLVIKKDQWIYNANDFIQKVEQEIAYPLFVKPANTGSSIGISKAKNQTELKAAITEAFKFDLKVIVEKALNIRELEVATLESLAFQADPIISVIGEIKPTHEFYSYEAKYVDEKGAELCIPAVINEDVKAEVNRIAKELFITLECEGMARIDLFLEKETQHIYFNEINTLPGFTQISMYPKLMAASGMSYSELLAHLIQLAMKRHAHKKQLIRHYVE
jgi:D-alanine-D-alanine ligase